MNRLPRRLHIVKDSDAGPDALQLPDFERRLTVACREYFRDSVRLDSLVTGVSHEAPLLQLADLFAGSVARKFNKEGETANAKDEFADFFETLAGFDFVKGGDGASDFVYVHRLGVAEYAAAVDLAGPQPGTLVELTAADTVILEPDWGDPPSRLARLPPVQVGRRPLQLAHRILGLPPLQYAVAPTPQDLQEIGQDSRQRASW